MAWNSIRRAGIAVVLMNATLHASGSLDQVKTSITSSGPDTKVTPPAVGNTVYQITGGTRPGQGPNLFYSFGLFSVGEGDTARFQNTNPAIATSNIISRVTGVEASNIYGTIDTLSYPGANLYLINPAGVIFGPNAKLDVGGSVHASTADYVRFADGAKFYANLSKNSALTVVQPAAFGFLGPAAPAQLTVQGSTLRVSHGQTLSLVGGDITIQTPSALSAPNGRIQIVALGSGGEVQLSASDGTPNLKLSDVSKLGVVDLSQAPLPVAESVLIRGSLSSVVPDGHIVFDGSLGSGGAILPDVSLGAPSYLIPAERGQIREGNLFQSFSRFDLYANESAIFQAPLAPPSVPISNILARITGGEQSFIDGTIRSDIVGANVFFLNPEGVLFGPSAQLKVPGAFHVSTATSVWFGDPFPFSTAPRFVPYDPDHPLVLSSTTPVSFDFTAPNPAAISILGSVLQVQPRQTLSVIGGDVQTSGATLAAPGGRVQIASLSSGGVGLDGTVITGSSLGSIIITNSLVGATGFDESGFRGLGSGTIVIRGGQLLVDASNIVAHTLDDVAGPRLIDIQVTGDVVLTNGAKISSLAFTADPGGDVTISARHLKVFGGSIISSTTDVDISSTTDVENAPGGNLTVKADTVTISGQDSFNNPSMVLSDAVADGAGGKISIRPRSSTLDLVLDNTGTIKSRTLGTDALVQAGDGGSIEIDATTVSALNGGNINSSTFAQGAGGNIIVRTKSLAIRDASSGIFAGNFGFFSTGSPGDISVTANNATITQGGAVQNGNPFSPSEAGAIEITAKNSLVISKGGTVTSASFELPGGQVSLSAPTLIMDGGFVNTSTQGAGVAGNVLVDAGTLTMSNGAQISSGSAGPFSGAGGIVTVKAKGAVTIAGTGSSVNPSTNDASTGLFSSTLSEVGAAGKVVVTASTLSISDGGKISVASTGAAPAGDISLTVGTLILSDGGGLFSNAASSGAGGSINVRAGQMQLTNGAAISAKSTGSALAGDVTIAATTFLAQDSSVTTEAREANGGNIDIAVGSMLYLRESGITTSVGTGKGKGGNITIDPQYVVLNGSQVLANAFGGTGGNITIVTDVFLSGDSFVNASSARNAPGEININARINNLSDSLVQLPDNVLQAAQLLRAACNTRVSAGKASSLVVSGREGVPPEPEGLLWSPLGSVISDRGVAPTEGYTEQFPQFVGLWFGQNCAR